MNNYLREELLFFSALIFLAAAALIHTADGDDGNRRGSVHAQRTNNIRGLLAKADPSARITAIRKAIEARDKSQIAVVMEHYRKLPQSAPSTGRGLHDQEKEAIVRAIADLDVSVKLPFLLESLDHECEAARVAKKQGSEQLFGSGPLTAILTALPKERAVIGSKLSSLYEDDSLPRQVRVLIAAAEVTVKMHEKHGDATLKNKIISIAKSLEPAPVYPVPWEIQRDKAKRIEYGKSQKRIQESRLREQYLASLDSIEEDGREIYLQNHGRVAVQPILQIVANEDLGNDTRETLMLIAARSLRNHIRTEKTTSEPDVNAVKRLTEYVASMPDLGAFDRRSYLLSTLRHIETLRASLGE